MGEPVLKSPFPYPGGKARVADLVWDRLGNCDNFVEPFAGSLAVLMRRPAAHFTDGYRVETVNDLNGYIVNFWRAVKNDPDRVAEFADSPVLEADLHARHKWLVRSMEAAEWREKMRTDPDHFDAKIAGWWVWGQCCWIGGAWCNEVRTDYEQMPYLLKKQGVTVNAERRPCVNQDGQGYGVIRGENPTDWEQIPDISGAGGVGVGVHSKGNRPQLTDAFDIGRGVNASGEFPQKIPFLNGTPQSGGCGFHSFRRTTDDSQPGICDARRAWLTDWMRRLSDRLRLVRTCYGHWSRICDSDSTLTRLGTTGVFLDPPYPANRSDNGKKSRDANLYATDKGADLDALRDEILAWCRKWGQDSAIRVCVCGYEGDGYEALEAEGWTVEAWEASGGYANQRRKNKGKAENAKRERLWFSPACLKPLVGPSLFDGFDA